MSTLEKPPARSSSRRFFLRGLAILLPSVLTIWILIAAYGFVQVRIAEPINRGVRELVIRTTPWPIVVEEDMAEHETVVRNDAQRSADWQATGRSKDWLRRDARRTRLKSWWDGYAFPMNLIGLVLAILLIYIAGALLGSYIGARLFKRGEELLSRLPIVRAVYPSVKQVTDFVVGSGESDLNRFNKVVAVEYPRKGIWSLGLLTGNTMKTVEVQSGQACVTVFIPSSPTPFTGYVITVPRDDTIELPISIEEALRFTISLGVVVPPKQMVGTSASTDKAQSALPA